jgi:hypothetical protein
MMEKMTREPVVRETELCRVCHENIGAAEPQLCPLLVRIDRRRCQDFPCNCCQICKQRCVEQT